MAAHRPDLAGRTGCRWLMLTAETAGLEGGSWRPPPVPGPAGWARLPQIATRTLGADTGSVRAARDFTVATLRRWGAAERSPDIAIVVSELVTNALQHALPGSGHARAGTTIRLGLLQPGPCLLCAVADPSNAAPAPRTRRSACRDRPRTADHRRAQRPVGLHHAQPDREGRVGPVPRLTPPFPGPVAQQARPRPGTGDLATQPTSQRELSTVAGLRADGRSARGPERSS